MDEDRKSGYWQMHLLAEWMILLAAMGPEPTISTVAGSGMPGFSGDGGPAQRARLHMPFDVALDPEGNLYISDTFNHCIRRIAQKTGIITTVAGSGVAGYGGDAKPADKAQLDEPYGIVVGSDRSLFIADRLNRRIRRVDARTGLIFTIVGNGTKSSDGDGGAAIAAGLVEPNGLALDRTERLLYIADVGGNRVRRVDLATGRISTFAGTGRARHDGDGGPAAAASVWGARAVEVGPDGLVYILEREGNSLRVVHPLTHLITTVAGTGAKGYSGDSGPARFATFNGPKELAVDRSGNIWIVDTENHAIRMIDAKTNVIRTVAGRGRPGREGDGGPAINASLDRPHGVAVGPDGTFWIGDTHNHRVRMVGPGR
jgi:DNA-binding beta-propeller fold protein YncE